MPAAACCDSRLETALRRHSDSASVRRLVASLTAHCCHWSRNLNSAIAVHFPDIRCKRNIYFCELTHRGRSRLC